MKSLLLISLFFFVLGIVSFMARASEAEKSFHPEDVNGVRQACLDYVEGFYESDAQRIQRGVHPDLVKRSIAPGDILSKMNRNELISASVNNVWKKPEILVEVFDISGNIAEAKVTSDFVDYVQLAKLKGQWQVVNVLWR